MMLRNPVVSAARIGGAANGLILMLAVAAAVQAQVEFVPDGSTQVIFGGKPQAIAVRVHRAPSVEAVTDDIGESAVLVCFRLFQETSGTVVPVGPAKPWKVLRVLPGQTIVETASVGFPVVTRPIGGLVRWETEQGTGLGSTRVWIVPPNAFGEVKSLVGDLPLGVVGIPASLERLLEPAKVSVEDLTNLPLRPEAQLILVWPGELDATQPELLARRIGSWVESGRNVVWFKTESASLVSRKPRAAARRDRGTLVTVDAQMVEPLDTAEAQWCLLSLLRWACQTTDW
jgi:hypothetical protein